MTTKTKQAQSTEPTGVLAQIAELQQMGVKELHTRWSLMMEGPPPGSREAVRQRLIYRVQEIAHGGLRRETLDRLAALARGDKTAGQNKAPVAGTVFRRTWHGEEHEVQAVEGGFQWKGRVYKSLTAVAKAITGQHWSGNLFFGITKRRGAGK